MRCFIISPIGQPGSPAREHADDVLECVIMPALEKASVSGRRADHVKDVGRITRQMYDDILSSDFCIALLHGHNPNVFYELAVAHSAGIPVIILSEKGHDPPFDLKDERVLHYDLGARSIYRGDNVAALLAMIESVRRRGGAREVPFGVSLTPLNASPTALPYAVSPETDFNGEFWVKLVAGAGRRLFLAGIGFTGWKGIPQMREALRTAAASGCDIRLLTMDADNPRFSALLNPHVSAADAEGQRQGLSEMRAWFQAAVGSAANSQVRALGRGLMFQQVVVADDLALVSPHLYYSNTRHSPCLRLAAPSPIFDAYLREFEQVWQLNGSREV